MTFKPSIISLDFETSGLNYWADGFKVLSAAFAWRGEDGAIKSEFIHAPEIGYWLNKIGDIPVVVHNHSFEYGVIRHCYPEMSTKLQLIDTMRLAQVFDNGGDRADALGGLSLSKCIQRISGRPDHKIPFYDWLRENGVKKGQEGANLDKLPKELFEAYNVADAVETLILFETITGEFAKIGYDYALDHSLYISISQFVSLAQARGIAVNRDGLEASIVTLKAKIDGLDKSFKERFKAEISALEGTWSDAWLSAVKTDKARLKRAETLQENASKWQFNLASTKHLKELFVDTLGIYPTFSSPKGKPSFKSSHLHSYGDGGQILATRGGLRLTTKQCENLLGLSTSGRWHLSLKTCGTATGRLAGSGGLNAQGLARREPLLMQNLIADPGHTLVSVDLSSGEPTATCHYSGDKNYEDAIFNMVGQDPYFTSDGLLKCDDIYLTAASFSPLGTDLVRGALLPGGVLSETPFSKSILEAAKKDQLKKIRALHKILVLGIGYAMGPRKMVESCRDAGFSISYKDAKDFYKAYWAWCPGVKQLSDTLTAKLERDGYLVNDFGYRLLPDAPHKAFNYWIQSTISGIMNALICKFFYLCPEAQFVTVIHDELVFQIPTELVAAAQVQMDTAVASVNDDLNWDVKVRTGWVTGSNLYEAK